MKPSKLLPKFLKLLQRDVRCVIHFNDVFSNRELDFDAELTAIMRNFGRLADRTYSIGQNTRLADHGVVLLDELLKDETRTLDQIERETGRRLKNVSDRGLVSIVNCAPRNSQTTQGGRNGEDFHLAITDGGLEIYAVPFTRLQGLASRNRILALYRIPNEALQTTDGSREQFRSSMIARARYFPESLEPIFQYETQKELVEAIEAGTHPQIIPYQDRLAEVGYSDKFGNVRVSVRNMDEFFTQFGSSQFGDTVYIQIGDSQKIPAYYVDSLKSIPEGKLGIYRNVADLDDPYSKCGYWEIVKRSEDPNHEKESAREILHRLHPDYWGQEVQVSME